MRALRLEGIQQLSIVEVPDPLAAEGEAVVEIRAASLNHRDVWIRAGQYGGLKFPIIPGSDGAGVVTSVGRGVDPSWVGRDVIMNPALNWGPDERAQAPAFSILGLPRDGTLAECVSIPATQLEAKPEHLSWEEAAALPLAGLTAWRAVFSRGDLGAKERILITGIGGGTALFALQFAVASGATAWVTSSSSDKIARAVQLGATGGFLYTSSGWQTAAAQASGLFDVIIDSSGGDGFGDLVNLCAPGGRIVFFGATRGNPPGIDQRKVFWRQISLLGSTMGSPQDWRAMLAFVARNQIRPVVSAVFPLDRGAEAFALMERGGQFGKIVVSVAK